MSFLHSESQGGHKQAQLCHSSTILAGTVLSGRPSWCRWRGLRYPEEQSWNPQPNPHSPRSKASCLPNGRHPRCPSGWSPSSRCSSAPTSPPRSRSAATFAAFGLMPLGDDPLTQIHYVALLLIADTILLIGLVLLFLKAHGERPADVFFGGRPWGREVVLALPLTLGALVIAAAVLRGAAGGRPVAAQRRAQPARGTAAHAGRRGALRRRGRDRRRRPRRGAAGVHPAAIRAVARRRDRGSGHRQRGLWRRTRAARRRRRGRDGAARRVLGRRLPAAPVDRRDR